ncbi:MAG: C10 family peptidase [Bacteroidales bacterium]|nr:C10 family peptidase [Bacteroidales bacterium]
MSSKTFFCIIALLCFSITLSAKEITREQAEKTAKNFFYEVSCSKGIQHHQLSINKTFTVEKNGIATYYAFNFDNGGFVIVSADDAYTPIIGYNTEFCYNDQEMPATLQSFYDSYSEQILAAKQQSVTTKYSDQWQRLLSDDRSVLNTKSRDAVPPLGAPLWNQGTPYNYFCPSGTGGKTYAGCVATAMHMVMYYWRWPFVGEGEHGYHFGEYGYLYANFAENYYDWDGMVYQPQGFYPEISKMMYHIGISVDMMYGPDGSGAYSQDVPAAMINHFKFKNTATHYSRYDYNGNWMQLLKDELNQQRLMYYNGCSQSGCHAFVCEGYNSDDYFYFNFGWGGQNNGYYTLESVGGYGEWQGVIVGLEPDEEKGYPYFCSGIKTVVLPNGSIADGSGPITDYQPNSNAGWLIDPNAGDTPIENITVTWRQLDLGEGSFLKFYDGENASAPLLAEFTHNSPTQTLTTTGKKLFVTFESGNATDAGFNFEYRSKVISTCSGLTVYNEPEGTLNDGSETEENYAPYSQCLFQINPENGKPLKLHFNRLQLSDDDFDKISIYNIYTNTDFRLITTLKGTYNPDDPIPDIFVETGNALIKFETNGYLNSKGWEISWRESSVSVEEQDFLQNMNIYPNPVSHQLHINFSMPQNDNVSLQLYSMTGQLVYHETLSHFIGNYNNTIQVDQFAKGVYLLKLTTAQGITTKKVVIQ